MKSEPDLEKLTAQWARRDELAQRWVPLTDEQVQRIAQSDEARELIEAGRPSPERAAEIARVEREVEERARATGEFAIGFGPSPDPDQVARIEAAKQKLRGRIAAEVDWSVQDVTDFLKSETGILEFSKILRTTAKVLGEPEHKGASKG